MLKSNNFNSIIDDLSAFGSNTFADLSPSTLDLETKPSEMVPEPLHKGQMLDNKTLPDNINYKSKDSEESLASVQLTAGLMQSFTPPLTKARSQLKELIGKQNKIYIDLSTEKYKLDNAEVAKLHEMMNDVKIYREKLNKIKKQMQNIYHRTKSLKKRAVNVQACKEKDYQRKVQKQQLEESLIGKQQ